MNFRKQFPINLLSNIIYFILNIVIGIWIVPYFIRHLGAEGYGLVALAVSVTTYVSLVKVSLNTASARFLAIDLQKNNFADANKVFNTAFWFLGVATLILISASGLFSYFVPHIFSVPEYLIGQARFLFFWVLLSFLITIFSSVFNISLFAQNRLDLRNMVDVSYLGMRTVFIIILFFVCAADLNMVGVGYLLGAVVSLAFSVYLWKKTATGLRVAIKYFDIKKLKDVFSMSSWLLINNIGSLLFLQIDLILSNILFGALIAGQYAAVIQWNVLLRAMAGVFSSVFAPMMLISHANNEKDRIVSISQGAVKFMALGMALPVGLLCGFAKPILFLWLGLDYVKYAPLMWIFAAHLSINLAVLPLFGINTALNKISLPAKVTLATGILNILLALVLAKYSGLGVFGIATAGAIVLTLKNAVFTPLYAAYILDIPKWTFVRPMWAGVLMTVFVTVVSYIVGKIVVFGNLFYLGVWGGIIGIFFAALMWAVTVNTSERKLLFSFLGRNKI